MPGRIPQHFIDDLLSRVDIVDVIDARVPLKKKGRDFMACCPFHNEKTPSFSVSQDKQFFYCFGCGASGSALGFLMDYDHMDFVEAVRELARMLGLEVPSEDDGGAARRDEQKPLLEMMDKADTFFRAQLREHPQARRAVDYLKHRGLSGEIARDFGIGYAPPGWDNLAKALGGDERAVNILVQCGLLKEKGERRYDQFRDRIMFPIHDRRGRVVAFGARAMGDDEPKYLNSPETAIFHKGSELYGLWHTRRTLRNIERLLVVEGYMDVVALAQFGIHFAVATLGTATTHDHLERLFRTATEVVFCFDGDRAGRKAGWRALENALPLMREGRQARFLFLPEGEDPDTLIRKEGSDAFVSRIENAVPLSEFLLDHLREMVDISSMDGRARMAELARPLLAKIPAGVYHDLLLDGLAREVGIDPALLGKHIDTPPPPDAHSREQTRRPIRPAQARGKTAPSLVRKAIGYLLHRPAIAGAQVDLATLRQLGESGVDLLADMIELARANPDMSTGMMLEHWRERPEGRHLALLAREEQLLEDPSLLATEFGETLAQLMTRGREHLLDQLLEKSRAGELDLEEKQLLNQLLSDASSTPPKA